MDQRFSRFVWVMMGCFHLFWASPVQAVSTGSCVFAGVAEWIVPGLGYAFLGDVDKALIFGGMRWAAISNYSRHRNRDSFEEDPENIFHSETNAQGETSVDIFLSRDTFYAQTYASIYQNLTFVTWYDLYDKQCEENSETYGVLFAPYQFWEWGLSPRFWIPTALISTSSSPGEGVTYHVDPDLTRQEMLDWSFAQYQLVGVGEEVLFRGVIQRFLFNQFSTNWSSPSTARWGSIVLASAIFGAAHSGQGFTAAPAAAFIFGLYLGWVYHPAEGGFNLTEAIAIHSWWDTILTQRILRDAEFVERQPNENAKNFKTQKETTLPLLLVYYRF